MTYETKKKEINKLNYDFQSDNLIALAKMVLVGHQILKQNNCEELLTLIDPNKPCEAIYAS
jgi:hypothetical protein